MNGGGNDIKSVTCARCGTKFCLEANLERSLRESGRSFYCPNGHSLSFKPSEVEKLRARVKRLESDLEWYRQFVKSLNERLDATEGTAHAYRMLYGKARKQAQRAKGLEA